MKINDVIKYLNELYPIELASDFDIGKIGLTIGDENIEVKNILLALDLTIDVVNEAISKEANLIITHHPFIFDPITKILFNSKIGKVLSLMFKHQISLYTMHTNLDVANGGVNDVLANLIGLNKIVGKNEKDAFMRIGEIEEMTFEEFVRVVKTKLELNGVRVVGNLSKKIKKVGIIGGSGSSEIEEAITSGCDCFVTGEIKLHHAQNAAYNNLCLIEVNHGVEKYVLKSIRENIKKRFEGKIEAYISKINTDPLRFL
ncbi:MAG TPA: Nif3-like dinuclear metal center hexameric protein [Bacilli bacterium]